MTRTPWFPARSRPKRKGWYECHLADVFGGGGEMEMLYWTGLEWQTQGTERRMLSTFGMMSGDRWRGLTKEAK